MTEGIPIITFALKRSAAGTLPLRPNSARKIPAATASGTAITAAHAVMKNVPSRAFAMPESGIP